MEIAMSRLVPNAALKIDPGGSHGLAETDAARFNSDVLDFIRA
jgi:non-heme chloroperoxidase